MSEGKMDVSASTIGDEWNQTRWPTCETPAPVSTDVTSLPRIADGATFGGQCACGVVLLALYIILCNYWPEIPTAFLALVTAVGLSGFLDKKKVVTVSSQTSGTNQVLDTHTEWPPADGLHHKASPESAYGERVKESHLYSELAETEIQTNGPKEHQSCPIAEDSHRQSLLDLVQAEREENRLDNRAHPLCSETGHRECQKNVVCVHSQPAQREHQTTDLGQRRHQSCSGLTRRKYENTDLDQKEHQSCSELVQRERQLNVLVRREHQSCSELAQRQPYTNGLGQREHQSCSELLQKERQMKVMGHQSYSELAHRERGINVLGQREHRWCSELDHRDGYTNDLGQRRRLICSEITQRNGLDQKDRLQHVSSEGEHGKPSDQGQREGQSCSQLALKECQTEFVHTEPLTNSVELRLSECAMGTGLIQTESEENVDQIDLEYSTRDAATQNAYAKYMYHGEETVIQGAQTDEEEATDINEICDRRVRQAFVKMRDFSGSTTDADEWPDLSDGETNVEDLSLDSAIHMQATSALTCDACPEAQADAVPKGRETGKHVSAVKKLSPDVKRTKGQNGHQCLSATKAKRSPRMTPRARVSSSETATKGPEMPAFGKVWREPEERVRNRDGSNGFISQRKNNTEDGDITADLTRELDRSTAYSEPSSDSKFIVTGDTVDQNLNCHKPCLHGSVPSDCLRDSVSAVFDHMDKGQIPGNLELPVRNKPCLDMDDLTQNGHAQMPDGEVSPVSMSVAEDPVSSATPQTDEANTQTVLFSDILRINIRRQLQAETRRFHTRRRRLRLKYVRELEKLRRELIGKNQILSSLQLKIPVLELEIHGLRTEKAELIRALQEERGKTVTLMGRLKDVYDRLMVINSAHLLQQQHLQFDHSMSL